MPAHDVSLRSRRCVLAIAGAAFARATGRSVGFARRVCLMALLAGAVLLAPLPASAQSCRETGTAANGDRVTKTRATGRFVYVNLFEPTTQTSGFLNAGRDVVCGTAWIEFAYVTPLPGVQDVVELIFGTGEIPSGAFSIDATGARLTLQTPFPVVRCEVDVNIGDFNCAEAQPRHFDLAWIRTGWSTEWQNTISHRTLGPLSVRSQGQFELRSATVSGTWDRFAADGMAGNLLDSRGTSVLREMVLQAGR